VTPEFVITPTADDVAVTLAGAISDHIGGTDGPTVGLAGGSTPAATYRECAGLEIPWENAMLWLADERWVPLDHPESNALMVTSNLGAGASRLATIDYDLGDPVAAAAEYEWLLDQVFSEGDGRPDLVLLGMGPDGHTASLFPGTEALEEHERRYVANYVPARAAWRLTATLPLLWSAHQVWFVVTGEDKAEVLAEIVDDHVPYPAQLVASGAGSVTWYLDEAAAGRLRRHR
jgi:6-phosphogluconolactonase